MRNSDDDDDDDSIRMRMQIARRAMREEILPPEVNSLVARELRRLLH